MINRVVEIFKEISSIPRCSYNCDAISLWLCMWANTHHFNCKKDDAFNVVIDIPASNGYESKPVIALQGHMDMVCEKTKDSNHDFKKDPIEVYEEDGWLKAKDTTLGADDGVALAIALAIAEDKTIPHPALKLLFTADEEVGLKGAMALKKGFFKADKLINIDSETEGEFVVGCAGGEDSDIEFVVHRQQPELNNFVRIEIGGLKGGHSGMEIAKKRLNAIKVLTDILNWLFEKAELADIGGGNMRNAIPSEASAVVAIDGEIDKKELLERLKEKYADFEDIDLMSINIEKAQKTDVVNKEDFIKLIDVLDRLPHGVYKMYNDEIVHTSNNLAVVKMDSDKIIISTNQRSLSEDGLDEITGRIKEVADRFGLSFNTHSRYPSWTPKEESPLLNEACRLYERMYSKKPVVKVIHAGLECGIIGSKVEGIDMISLGPDIEFAHTPKERLNLASLERVYNFIVELLKQ
ncbi:beta-Ala-His dipeptidase [Hippea jasoniae]|uniref:beta-Ala-His dipeptidase n=1 Tax=Hippea jasoniae TaxID=944479 RepID=UPI00054FE8DF|nr:beta-Ala-His dipeptidase [Hippea jasoniae]